VTTPIRMLLAEDNPSDRDLFLASLADTGLTDQVHVASDGVEALAFLFPSEAPRGTALSALRVVVLDLKLPRVDGFEVLRAIRAAPRLRQLPVVMLTSSNVERDVVLAYELGANSYVQKPVDFDRFRDVVRQLGRYWLGVNEPPPSREL
jgi:two-component system response regulator